MRDICTVIGRAAGAVALCTFVFAAAADAQTTRHATVATFSGPVRLPSIVLPAGTYTFDLPAWSQNQDMVAIFNDRNQFVAIARVVQTRRGTTGPSVVLMSNRADAPPTVSAVYYAGSTSGYEFVYNNRPTGTLLAEKDTHKR